jgi:hypothetical protein
MTCKSASEAQTEEVQVQRNAMPQVKRNGASACQIEAGHLWPLAQSIQGAELVFRQEGGIGHDSFSAWKKLHQNRRVRSEIKGWADCRKNCRMRSGP